MTPISAKHIVCLCLFIGAIASNEAIHSSEGDGVVNLIVDGTVTHGHDFPYHYSGDAAEVFTGNRFSKWCFLKAGNYPWVAWTFNNSRREVANLYELTTANDKPQRDPKHWKIYGSNDGTTWDLLDEQDDVTWSSRFESRRFAMNNTVAYNSYKFEFIERIGDDDRDRYQIAEWKLYYAPDPESSLAPEPWFPIYDPFILGDNCYYDVQETGYEDILSDIELLRRYLAIRDAYPTMALKNTRVLALSGMTLPAIELFHESLRKQEKNPNPVDMYFYSDYKIVRYIYATEAIPLISLAEYTRPSRIVFGDGSFMREGMATVIQWMVDNRNKGYFVNLEYFQISGHKAASYEGTEEEAIALQNQIVSNLHTMCVDKVNFPKLNTFNFNSNAFNEFNNGFDGALRGACDRSETGVTISAYQVAVYYPTMCSTTNEDNYGYYNMSDANEVSQCRFTWNWEVGDTLNVYAPSGPYPNDWTDSESYKPTPRPTTQPPTTVSPPTQPPATPTPSPTTSIPQPHVPIYDPFILGDNCNYESPNTCFDMVIPDTEVLRRYLAIRDAYPTMALKRTRVFALSGMTLPAIELFHESLKKQEKNPNPVDLYFYSDYKIVRYIYATLAIPLISLAEYTRPSRIVFGDGSFMREGMAAILQWMVDNRNKGYFVNLEYFQISGHKANSFMGNWTYGTVLQNQIVSNLHTMCMDKVNFPKLNTFNFNSNAFNEFNNGFDGALRGACDRSETGVTISAYQVAVYYPTMCSTTNEDNYGYYNMSDANEVSQCRFTWNWEVGDTLNVYAPSGPYPNDYTRFCDDSDFPPRPTPQPTTPSPSTQPPTPTPTPTPTPEYLFPVYDPFILGDNCNYESPNTCFENIIPDMEVLRRYLSIRDAYPTMALKRTRVLALSGMTLPAIELFRESLSKQVKNPAAVDMYFYSDYMTVRYVDATMVVPLISLSQFTYPSRIIFGDGTMKREGMAAVIQWMVDNRGKGYFVNLEYFQISGHSTADYNYFTSNGTALQNQIVANLHTICMDKVNFPKLSTLNFNSNGYNLHNNGFDAALIGACDRIETGVSIRASQVSVLYPTICSTSHVDNYWYYDMSDERDVAQCRFTWNWEMGSTLDVYAPSGPFPNANTIVCNPQPSRPSYPFTPIPTSSPPPNVPIYDPFILGDNCNYEVQETCYYDIYPDLYVLSRYLALRDLYPTMALKYTRVLALSGMTTQAVELYRKSLQTKEKNPYPIDMYFYSDYKIVRYVTSDMAVPLISLAEFTRPSRIVFGDGTMKREGMAAVIHWMVDNRDKGYFVNLEYFQISGHNAASYSGSEEEAIALQNQIVANLHSMCTDKVNFPKLHTMIFDRNGYNEFNNGFDAALRSACNLTETDVLIRAIEAAVAFPTMCSTTHADNYKYYDMNNEKDVAKCRYTWNWEMGDTMNVYAPSGPYPNDWTDCGSSGHPRPTLPPVTLPPTTQPPTTSVPTTIAPTTVAPTTVVPTTVAPSTITPTTQSPTTLPPTTVAPTTQSPTTTAPTTTAPTPSTQPPTVIPPTVIPPTTVPPTPTPTPIPTTVAPTTQPPTTTAPTTIAPTTQTPTTVAPTTHVPTTTPPTTQPPTTLPPTTLPPPSSCPAAPFLPQSPVDAIASTPCGEGYIGQKTFTCKLVESEAQWVLTNSECSPIESSIGTIVISITIEISGIIAEGSDYIEIIRRILSIILKVPFQSILIWDVPSSSRRLLDTTYLEVRVSIDTANQEKVEAVSSLSSAVILEEAKKADPAVFPPTSSLTFTKAPRIADIAGKCGDGFISLYFSKELDGTRCELRVSDGSMKTDGLVLIDKLTSGAGYCLNPGYYYLGCDGPTTVTVEYLTAEEKMVMRMEVAPYSKILRLEQIGKSWSTVPESHFSPNLDKNQPLTGQSAYPADPTDEKSDFSCDEKGYVAYLSKWSVADKSTSRDVESDEFKKHLSYFIESCEKIHEWNAKKRYRMEFTFYADWHVDEFEELATTKQRYSGVKTPVPAMTPVYNNTNYRYLMPSMDPCDGDNELREIVSRPQNCSVSWAFAITNSIEYAIKKMYFEEYDQIVEVSLSAQELIDCVGEEHGVVGKKCDGMPLVWGFDYVYENGIAFGEFYRHRNVEGECVKVDDEHKYHIAGYEKPSAYNKLGLFDLMMKGPVAVTLGLDLEFFQYYRNDRSEGPYFNTGFWRPSVNGVVVEYSQYAVDGESELSKNPYFAIETRLRGCDSMVFRLPILENVDDANMGGIAGFAIRPLITDLLPTPAPFTLPPTAVVKESEESS